MNNIIHILESINAILNFYHMFSIWNNLLTMSTLIFLSSFFMISTSNKFLSLLDILINKTDNYDEHINKLIKSIQRRAIISILIFINIFLVLTMVNNHLKHKVNNEILISIKKFKNESLENQKTIINEDCFYNFIVLYSAFLNKNEGKPEDTEQFLKYLFSLSNNKTNSTITNKISINP